MSCLLAAPVTHLHKSDWTVEPVEYAEAKRFVERHHYAQGAANTGRAHGVLNRRTRELVGVALWLPPTKAAAVATFPEGDWRRVVSLSRLAVAPDMPTNAASFLLGRSMRLVKQSRDYDCLVTYADERRGHTGAIYRATNWEYLGLVGPKTFWLDPSGRQVAAKSAGRNRTVAELLAMGCVRGSSRKHKFRKVLHLTPAENVHYGKARK